MNYFFSAFLAVIALVVLYSAMDYLFSEPVLFIDHESGCHLDGGHLLICEPEPTK